MPKDIVREFREYYISLYNLSVLSLSPSSLEEYLISSQLARLPSPARRELETPITIEEVSIAMKAMKHGKAPGPDGFSLQYFKSFFFHQ